MSNTNDTTALNAYRLTSMEEPTDEMLSAIMREAAEEACKTTEEATSQLFRRLNNEIAQSIKDWSQQHSK